MSRSVKQEKRKGFLDHVAHIRKHRKMIAAMKQELINDDIPEFYDDLPLAAAD